jgi:hypothetical protein
MTVFIGYGKQYYLSVVISPQNQLGGGDVPAGGVEGL